MRTDATLGPGIASVPVLFMLRRLAVGVFAVQMASIGFVAVEPAPYDLLAVVSIALWFSIGTRLHARAFPFVAILVVFTIAKLLSLLPILNEAESVTWVVNSTYLAVTGVLFVMIFSEDTNRRLDLALTAYTVSAVLAAIAGILGYFDIAGLGAVFSLYDRAMGPFKDPNVFGSFLMPAAVYLVHGLTVGRLRRPVVALTALAILMAGILLSFSRGSWGATVFATGLSIAMAFATSRSPRLRSRILLLSVLAAMAAALVLAVLLSVDEVAERFMSRAQVTQEYDEGVTGRFGNQLRSIPLLIERPMGFGPLGFRVIFGLEPHNSYIGAFANAGWLGGFCFAALVLTTGFVGFRLCVVDSPFRPLAQTVWPALFALFLQGFQIDIDHWRHLYVLLGAVWGLEVARRRWLAGVEAPQPARA